LYPKQQTDRGSGIRAGLEGLAKSLQNLLPMTNSHTSLPDGSADDPVFYFLYERRPFSASKIDHRLHVRSQPLNIVYNPTVVQHVSEFFKIPDELNRTTHLSEKIRSAAYSRIEEAKQRTREELKKNLNSILKGDVETSAASRRTVWDVVFDLSAPQILVPEHFIDRQALIMVIDFGKLHFTNRGDQKQIGAKIEEVEDDEDDDEFCTPASSPRSLEENESPPITGGKYTRFLFVPNDNFQR
jgi:vacuolar protein sorting-associated protein 13D